MRRGETDDTARCKKRSIPVSAQLNGVRELNVFTTYSIVRTMAGPAIPAILLTTATNCGSERVSLCRPRATSSKFVVNHTQPEEVVIFLGER